MAFVQLIVLAIVQGITEFLPISSSGHLVLVPALTGWPDQGRVIDVAVHVGTLGAVVVYFRRDLVDMVRKPPVPSIGVDGPKLLGFVVLATIPVIAVGGLVYLSGIDEALRSVEVIAWTTLGFGALLYLADRYGLTIRRVEDLTWGSALAIGVAQVLALVPGTSRAGITITMARVLGYERDEAARFSMLLSIPAILAAAALGAFELWRTGNVDLGIDALVAAVLAFGSAFVAISAMMSWLRRATYTPFVVYRLILGGVLLYLVYAG